MMYIVIIILFVGLYPNVTYADQLQKFTDSVSSIAKSVFQHTTSLVKKVGVLFNGWVQSMYQGKSKKNEGSETFSRFVQNRENSDKVKPTIHNFKPNSVVQLESPELAYMHGRRMESHVVKTKDEYFLTLHRLKTNYLIRNRTVLLHHGLLGSSTDWILLGAEKSLPYILADAGYDVWITNSRGNYYSRGHTMTSVDLPEYWDFSWQEIGQFDLPAVLDYISQEKNTTEKINFICHSMGATALLVLLSTAPQYNEYLRMGILLAPLAFMSNIKGPLVDLASESDKTIETLGDGEFLPSRKVPNLLAQKYCKGPKSFCNNPLLFLSGFNDYDPLHTSFIARLLYYVPAGGSLNTILHYIQLYKTGKFHAYNNELSDFPLNKITLPIALFSSSDDWLSTVPDVLKLYLCLQNPIDHHIIRGQNVTHTDFMWGNVTNTVYKKIKEYLEEGLTWSITQTNEIP